MGQVSKLQPNELLNISIDHQAQINKLCQYLRDNFNIENLSYQAILPNNTYFILHSNTRYLAEYLASGLYMSCPFLSCEDKAAIPQIYMPFLSNNNTNLLKHQALCEKHHLYQPITFANFNRNIQETMTFFYLENTTQAVNLYLNSTNKLQSYINFFKKNISTIIEEYSQQLPSSSVILDRQRVKSIFNEIKGKINTADVVNNSVDHLVKIIPKLTFREAQVLQFYLEYRSAKEIARYTDLSTRTVEKHIENFKKKIGLRKKEMILQKVKSMLTDAV